MLSPEIVPTSPSDIELETRVGEQPNSLPLKKEAVSPEPDDGKEKDSVSPDDSKKKRYRKWADIFVEDMIKRGYWRYIIIRNIVCDINLSECVDHLI